MKIIKGLTELFDEFIDLFWGVGYFGWQIATAYALYVSFQQDFIYAVFFFILFSLSGYLNHAVLKDLIQDPRPADGVVFLASEKIRKRTNGMPSGHAQQTAFALTIAYLFTHKHLMISVALFSLTVLQRFIFRNHTLPQLIAGGALGFVLGYASYYIMRYLEKPTKNVEMTVYSDITSVYNLS
jgi:acid phosphatase family membrane protein YuiD